MSFRKIEALAARNAAETGVIATLAKRGEGVSRLLLTLGAETLKAFTTADPFEERWRVLLGEDEDAGSIRVMLDSDGEFRLSRLRGGAGRLTLGAIGGLADARIHGKPCHWSRVSNLCIEIDLPPAFFAKGAMAVAVPARIAAPPTKPRRGLGSY